MKMSSRNNLPWIKDDFLPNIVDRRAIEHPEAVFAEYPLSPRTYGHGFRGVTYRDLANVVNGLAHWLEKTLGVAAPSECLPYLGPNDVRYPALILAAIKTGHTVGLSVKEADTSDNKPDFLDITKKKSGSADYITGPVEMSLPTMLHTLFSPGHIYLRSKGDDTTGSSVLGRASRTEFWTI